MKKQTNVTKEGLVNLKNELEELVNVKRPKIVERLTYALSQGDLAENSDYSNAKEELEFLDGRIDELRRVLDDVKIIDTDTKRAKGSAVDLGTKVTVGINGSKHIYEIVGEWEADPMNKRISPESPLGQALVGKRVGEAVEVEAPVGKVLYKILAIE